MRTSPTKCAVAAAAVAVLMLSACGSSPSDDASNASGSKSYTTREVTDGTTTFTVVENPNNGTKLSFGSEAGFTLLEEEQDGYTYAFKDMNGNGTLDAWEDWRKTYEERAADLAPQLAADQVSGLMLFSGHERAASDGLTDAQKEYLSQSYLRNVLYAGGNEVEPVVQWTNEMQSYVETLAVEGTPYIPVNFSSDPRHDAANSYSGATGGLSQWPSNLGFAATFDPETVLAFGKYASEEYRALGLANALSPQIDLGTDPRWSRINGTFGEDPDMASKMAAAYVEGFQGTFDKDGKDTGWGQGSVSTVIKHFPGDGSGEGGRESHNDLGKYAVMPGDNGKAHLKVFDAAMDADAGGMMTSYSIVTDGEGNAYYGNLMGSAYDKVRLDLARDGKKYDGVIVTDWGVTKAKTDPESKGGKAWGAESLSVDQRHFEILKAGVDQFGGNNDIVPVRNAYQLWDEAFKAGEVEVDAATRWAESGRRILTNLFSVGLYDNPFQDLEESTKIAGNEEAAKAGQDAQHKSVVVVKNQDKTIECGKAAKDYSEMKVYIPRSYDIGRKTARGDAKYTEAPMIDVEVAKQYFGEVVTDEAVTDADGKVQSYTAPDLSDVDMVLVKMTNPDSGGMGAGRDDETGTYYPITLQYRPYTADGENVRKVSIAGDTLADGSKENRSYFGQTSRITNEAHLDSFERAVAAVEASGKDIPVVTIVSIKNAMVIPTEFEAKSDAILLGFSVSDNTLLDVALGINDSQGRLPIGLPASMDAVEKSYEDLEKDVDSYVDSAGNTYAYGFGLGCGGTPIK
ncbi:hypothetical protein I6E29_07075 [Arcanobacterium haemolyticum]|nr:hypothetical protein [Arcanobacterium haemolyticum]